MYINPRTQTQLRRARRHRMVMLRFLAAALALAYVASVSLFALSAAGGR